MTSDVSDQLKDIQVQKELLATQKEIIDLKSQIAAISKDLETPAEQANNVESESTGESEEGGSAAEGEAAESESDAQEGAATMDSYLAEITAYEVLKATAIKVGNQFADIPEIGDTDRILVLCEQCLMPRCLPLSDVVRWETRQQIEIITDQVEGQSDVMDGFLKGTDLSALLGLKREIKVKGGRVKEKEQGLAGQVEEEEQPTISESIASFISGWGSPVTAATELITGVSDLLGQFASTLSVKERGVALPLDAYINAFADTIKKGQVHLFNFGSIETSLVTEESVLGKLNKLIKAIRHLEEQRILLAAKIIAPLNAEVLKRTNTITKLESSRESLNTEINAAKKRIGELGVKKQHETDSAKKLEFQKEIDLEMAGLNLLQGQWADVIKVLLEEKQSLDEINLRLNKANGEAEVAFNLVKTFNTFFQGITAKPDTTTLSSLAQAILRDYMMSFDYLLGLSIHSGNGETITRKILNLESRRFIGGCVISYTLTRKDGKVIKSGLEVAAGQRKFNFGNPAKMKTEGIPMF